MKKLTAMLLALAMLVPAACAVTKEDIKAELGVFRLDELERVESIEIIPAQDCPQFVLTLEEGIIMGGSEVSGDGWFTSEGIMCEADVDMNGDGSKEYVVAYSFGNPERWPEPELRLRIYARNGEGYALKGDFPLIWNYDNATFQSWVRIVSAGGGAAIFTGGTSEFDGAVDSASVIMYGYNGENCTLELRGNASNQGDCTLYQDVILPVGDARLSYNDLIASVKSDGESPEEEYSYSYPPADDSGLKKLNAALDDFGIEIQYDFFNMDGDPDGITFLNIDTITGGRDFQTTSSNEDYCTLTLGMSGPEAEAQMEGLEIWAPKLSDDSRWEIIPDSDTRKLTKAELSGCDSELLGYIRNEILARHGYPFTKEKYQTYFGSKRWYEISEDFDYSRLSESETANIALIQSLE